MVYLAICLARQRALLIVVKRISQLNSFPLSFCSIERRRSVWMVQKKQRLMFKRYGDDRMSHRRLNLLNRKKERRTSKQRTNERTSERTNFTSFFFVCSLSPSRFDRRRSTMRGRKSCAFHFSFLVSDSTVIIWYSLVHRNLFDVIIKPARMRDKIAELHSLARSACLR